MKNLYKISLFILFIISSCAAQKEMHNNIIIEYKAQTRGSFLSIKVENDSIFYKTFNLEKTTALKEEEIQNIVVEVKKLNLSKISSLEAPSTKRFSDGALAATIKIINSEDTFISSEFDHENPPKELLELYVLLVKYTK
ncbi:hypothetical protein [uncultured Polaribacter sp.]|uniref:hypothetical protein n=1 Tax=uncultured Polaribacter sp. TaxID=174711 RepID=UPI002633ABE3|nr:hypothetical protein [uncultured Polaribacter sp.]